MKNTLKRGFTLVELLVVVLIIGILSAVALPQYTRAVEKSRASEALIMLKNAQKAYELKYLEDPDVGNWPAPKDIVDWSSGTWSDDGYYFCTRKFYYEFAHPDIYAHRSDNIESDCSTFSTRSYGLNIQVPPDTGWENFKSCDADDDTGYNVCQGLVSQGFDVNDNR